MDCVFQELSAGLACGALPFEQVQWEEGEEEGENVKWLDVWDSDDQKGVAREVANPPLDPIETINVQATLFASFSHLPSYGTSSKRRDQLCKECKDHCCHLEAQEFTDMTTCTAVFEAQESTDMAAIVGPILSVDDRTQQG